MEKEWYIKPDRTPAELERMLRKATPVPEELRWACERSLLWGVWENGADAPRGEEQLSFFPPSTTGRST